MTQPITDPSAAPPLALLAQFRRATAHDVNNLLAVIRGNVQLLPALDADHAPAVCAEIDLACERLALLCDGWLLANADPPQPGDQGSCMAQVMQQAAAVAQSAYDADIRIAPASPGLQRSCAIDARNLRALLYWALVSLLHCGNRPVITVALDTRDGWCTAHLQMACDAHRLPVVAAPCAAATAGIGAIASAGLWDVAQCLQRHGGGLQHAYTHGIFHLRLELPGHEGRIAAPAA